jgi:hypothetical protein
MNIGKQTNKPVVRTFIHAITLACGLICNRAVQAQDANLAGVFTNPNQSEEPIKQAIESGASQFGFLARPIARSRLKKINPNITRVEIEDSGGAFTITLGQSKPSAARPGGPSVKWTKDDETYDVSLAWHGTTLVQTFVAPDGTRINRYTLSADGHSLAVQIAFSSRMLKRPVSYTLNFKRTL